MTDSHDRGTQKDSTSTVVASLLAAPGDDSCEDFTPNPPSEQRTSRTTGPSIRTSFDPNDKHGPAAFGSQGFIQTGLMSYEIEFENDPNLGATIPAQEVFVTDTLDADLDLTTVEFTGFGFNNFTFSVPPGLSNYETTIDLRPEGIDLFVPVKLEVDSQTRVLKATFRSLDPLTGLLPDEFDAGFLPVNDKALRNGEGFFTYTVRPLANHVTGTEITNQGSIVFDVNARILTPTTRNTLDENAPTSSVLALPTQSTSSFTVSWSGTDDSGGSGIASYDIFVSEDGGEFTLFVTATTDKSTLFQGEANRSYAFYSIAIDNVGLREQAPSQSDTQTTVITSSIDFGDAPSKYAVLLARNGARHVINGPRLGTAVDAESDGQPSAAADGDGSDDDGVLFNSTLLALSVATTSSLTVSASTAAKLDAWIDFNNDGDWLDAGEQIASARSLIAGNNLLSFTVPAGASIGNTAARFRLSSAGGLAPTGEASDGEVEDYLQTIVDGDSTAGVTIRVINGSIVLTLDASDTVIRSGGTELFRALAARIASFEVRGTATNNTVTIDFGSGFALPAAGVSFAGGGGSNTLAVVGAGSLDLTDPKNMINDFHSIMLPSDAFNQVSIDRQAVNRLSPSAKSIRIAAGLTDSVNVKDSKDWRLGAPKVEGSTFVLAAQNKRGGNETIEAVGLRPFNNFLQLGDVNNSGTVTAGDALAIIFELNQRTISSNAGDLVDPTTIAVWPCVYFDVNGDGRVSALDALNVINVLFLESLLSGSSESSEPKLVAQSIDSVLRDNESSLRKTVPTPVIETLARSAKSFASASIPVPSSSLVAIDDVLTQWGTANESDDEQGLKLLSARPQ